MNLRQVILFFLAIVVGLEAKASELQVQTAILLDEGGVPRCRVSEFSRGDAEIGPTVFDDLRECDERDELYARLALETEEISYGVVFSPMGKALLAGFVVGGVAGCLMRSALPFLNSLVNSSGSEAVAFGTAVIIIPLSLMALLAGPTVAYSFAGAEIGASGLLVSLPGNGVGIIACDRLAGDKSFKGLLSF